MSQRQSSLSSCKNHQNIEGDYFISGQPWKKYCSECALNLALYGKKIDKDHSTQQLGNKTLILSFVQKIKLSLKKIQQSKSSFTLFISKFQNIQLSQLSSLVNQFNSYINYLTDLRNQIICIYQTSFYQSLQTYLQRQTKIFLCQTELKNNLQYIERSFTNLVQAKQPPILQTKISQWTTTMQSLNHLLPKPTQQQQLNQFINQRTTLIKHKIFNIQSFLTILPEQKKNYFIDLKYIDNNSIKKTLQTSIFEDDLKQNCKKNPTHLKLRSKSKKREQPVQKQSLSAKNKKIMRDVSNFQILQSFQI